jgi:sulfur relay (sulfurtransferase) DsrF/TusC family protein
VSELRSHAHAARRGSRAVDVLLALTVGFVGAAAALLQLFAGPDIGLADNGDGFRLMCETELLKRDEVLFNPLVVEYDPAPDGCAEELRYFSTQQWVLEAAVQLFALRYGEGVGFDLRMLGVLHSALLGAGLAALHLALPGSRAVRTVSVVVAGALVADVAFVSYFTSPFSEPATFLGLLFAVAALAWYVRADRAVPLALLLLTAAGVFLALAKSQTVVLALLLVPVVLLRTVPVGRLTGPVLGRVLPALAAVVLVAAPAANLTQQPPFFTRVNVYNVVFWTLLPLSPDPEATLRELSAPPSLARYSGTGYFTPGSAQSDPAFGLFEEQVSRGDVLAYLATHPGYWEPLLAEGSRAAATARPDYMSNYREPRPEGQLLAPRPDPTVRLLGSLGRWAWPVLPLVWTLVALGGAVVALRAADPARRALAAVLYLLAAGALSQVVVALLGDGVYELVKHTVLAGWATALLLGVGAGAALAAAVGAAQRRRAQGTVVTNGGGSMAGAMGTRT